MDKPFDILWFGEGGPIWIDSAATLESAEARIETLRTKLWHFLNSTAAIHSRAIRRLMAT
jgi:hypothetical protein